ncbi:MAG: hypothetical protein NT031_10885, partial [Planctomycetota bacterium]|nr:hypothetical protein [Planctomycetota bacterium]
MNKSVVGWVVAGLAVLCVASVAPGGTEADYKALFGEEEQKVVAGADAKAAGAFAVKLLDAAKTVGGQKDLQSLLCEKAYQFGKKDPSGYAAAIEAMKLQMEAVPDKKAQAQDRLLEVTGLQYAKSAGAERVRLGQEL